MGCIVKISSLSVWVYYYFICEIVTPRIVIQNTIILGRQHPRKYVPTIDTFH